MSYVLLEITTTRGLLTTSVPLSSIQNLTLFNLVKHIESRGEMVSEIYRSINSSPFGGPPTLWMISMIWQNDSGAWAFCKQLLATGISSHISVDWLEEELSYMD